MATTTTPQSRESHKKLTPKNVQHAQVATYDTVTMIAMSEDVANDAKHAIDASRGKPGVARFAPSPLIRDQLAASRARKDSMILLFDLSRLVPMFAGRGSTSPPIALSFGTADRNAHFRLMMAAETLHAAAGATP